MIYAVIHEYCSDPNIITEVRPKHREYLTGLLASGKLVAAGPFLDDAFGALIVFDAESTAEVETLIHGDPFHTAGVFQQWTIRPWKMVFANPALMPS